MGVLQYSSGLIWQHTLFASKSITLVKASLFAMQYNPFFIILVRSSCMPNNPWFLMVLEENHKNSKRVNYINSFISGFGMYDACTDIRFLCCSVTFWDFVWIINKISTFVNENHGVKRLKMLDLWHSKLAAANP